MKVTFVHLGREHLGIEYMSVVLKQAGHEVELAYDPGLFGVNDNVLCIPMMERVFSRKQEVVRTIVEGQPDIVGFSAYTNTFQWCCEIAREVKPRIEAPIVFGGSHPTMVPEHVLRKDFVDYVFVGECEYAFLEFVDALELGRPVEEIQNLWLKKDGDIIQNPIRPPIADLDAVPLPDKALFEKDIAYGDDYVCLSSRGCPNNCTYCGETYLNKLYHHRYFRQRSVDSVMHELSEMHARYRLHEVMFFDSILFTSKEWLGELCRRFREELGIPLRCEGHVNYFDEDVGRMLKDAGCYCINFGLQSINATIRREVLHRYESDEKVVRAFRICDKLGIKYDVDLMFDLPGESDSDYEDAVRFFSRGKALNRLKSYNLTFFPQLPIAEIALEEGLITPAEVEGYKDGIVGDLFHSDSVHDRSIRRARANFRFFYKILPLLPAGWADVIIRHKWYRVFHLIPKPISILGEILVAIRNRDYRYWLYLKHYVNHFKSRFLSR